MPKVNKQRDDILEKLENIGVIIPLWDGVMIDENARIAPGATILPGTIIEGESSVGGGSVIGPNSYLKDAVIGENCTVKSSVVTLSEIKDGASVGPFSQIRPGSVVGADVKIGDFVEVKNSSIGAGTKIAHLTYVGDTDCGERVNFGCGVVTVNYNGKAKSRTVIEDDAFIGCNTNLVAPVKVGKGAYTAAGSTVTKDLPDNSLCIARAREVIKPDAAKKFKK